MKKTLIFALSITTLVATIFFVSCKKINLATELGQGLIPEVDNIHTFDTTLEVNAFNNLFTALNDTFRTDYNAIQVLGKIDNDPFFGKTDARMFFQISPPGISFPNTPDKLFLDSVVLVVSNVLNYGDSTTPQTIQVSEIGMSNEFKADSFYLLSQNFSTAGVLGSVNVVPRSLKDSVLIVNYPDTVKMANKLRVKLDNSFGQRLLEYDSLTNASDSVFKTKFKGLALQSITAGNTLMGFSLLDTNTKLMVYYRYQNKTDPTNIDTATASYSYNTATTNNAVANYIKRDFAGTPYETAMLNNTSPAQQVFIQSSPGSYATLKIPALANFEKNVIHLAELQMESIYDPLDTLYNAPTNLFLDVYDSVSAKYKSVPYAFGVTTDQYGAPVLGGYDNFYSARVTGQRYYYKTDPSSNIIKQWRFNLTRYVQKVVLDSIPLNSFRLYAPAGTRLPLGDPEYSAITTLFQFPQSSAIVPGMGRVRIAGGNSPVQKMKLRIVYSKP